MNIVDGLKRWWTAPSSASAPHEMPKNSTSVASSSTALAASADMTKSTLASFNGLNQGKVLQQNKINKIAHNPYLVNADRSCCSGPGIIPVENDIRSPTSTPNIYSQNDLKGTTREGFDGLIGPTVVNDKNKKEYDALLALQKEYNSKLSAYSSAHKTLMNSTKNYITSTNATERKNFNMRVTRGPLLSEIPVTKEGCYLVGNDMNTMMDKQTDLGSNVSEGTCTMRAADLGHSVFGLRGGTGECYVGNNIVKAKSAGLAFMPVTALTFYIGTVGASINQMQVFNNGQMGFFNSADNYVRNPEKLFAYGNEEDGCNIYSGGNIQVQTATYGGNCDNQHEILPMGTITGDMGTNYCMNQEGGSSANLLQANMRTCLPGNLNQQFTYKEDSKQIVYGQSGKCLDVFEGRADNNTKVIQYSCHSGENQKWKYMSDKTFRPAFAPTKCLNIYGGNASEGQGLTITQCGNNEPRQQFTIRNADGTVTAPPAPPPPPVPQMGDIPWVNQWGALRQISHNYNSRTQAGLVCGVNQQNYLYCADKDIETTQPDWKRIGKNGELNTVAAVSVTNDGNSALVLKNSGEIYTINSTTNDGWSSVNFVGFGKERKFSSPHFTQVEYSNGRYCGLDPVNYRVSCKDNYTNNKWIPISDPKQITKIAMSNNHLYGLDLDGFIWYLENIMGTGTWLKVGGTGATRKFQQLSVDSNGKVMCGILKDTNDIYCADTNLVPTAETQLNAAQPNWKKINGQLMNLSLKNGRLYGVNAYQQIYTGKVYNLPPATAT